MGTKGSRSIPLLISLPHAQRKNFVNRQLSGWISSKLDQELSSHHDSQWKPSSMKFSPLQALALLPTPSFERVVSERSTQTPA